MSEIAEIPASRLRRMPLIGEKAGKLSLATRFALAGGVVMIAGMAIIGFWMTERLKAHVIENTAQATALLMDSFIAPLTQELAKSDTLSPGPVRALEEMLESPALSDRVVAIKIWKPGGYVAWSSVSDIMGERFEPSPSLLAAWQGNVVAEYDALDEDESSGERARNMPLLEIYSPVREYWSGDIIAVAEFYEDTTVLQGSLHDLLWQSWIVVGLTTFLMALSLYGIVLRGSRMIDRQREVLGIRMQEMQRIAEQNTVLRERVQRASAKGAELNEQYLRRISADLHDGPAQLVSLAALKIDGLARIDDREKRGREIGVLRDALGEAMTDIRDICSGLSMPDIETLRLVEIVGRVAATHEDRTGISVDLDLDIDDEVERHAPQSIRITVYRFVQEGLNNAFRHAPGNEVRVHMRNDSTKLVLSVIDRPPPDGVPPVAAGTVPGGGLGLAGLRQRVESLGGSLSFETTPQEGSTLEMTVDTGERASL